MLPAIVCKLVPRLLTQVWKGRDTGKMDPNLTPQAMTVHSTNFLYKVAGYASVLLGADYLIRGLYPSLWPVSVTVFILAVTGVVGDMTIVPTLGNVKSLALGFFGITAIIWGTALFWPGSHMTLGRAVVITLFIGLLEYALHEYVLRNLFTKKI